MSPSKVNAESTLVVEPIPKSPEAGNLCNYGAIVTNIDLNDITDADVEKLKETIWRYKVVVVKRQQNLDPKKQWEFVTRSDPDAPQVHSHGNMKDFNKKGGMLSASRQVFGIPGAENVRLVGKGYQGEDHFGLKNVDITAYLSNSFHAKLQQPGELEAGNTRFQRWHIDAPLYERDPAWFTTLRAVKLPQGPDVTINWDNETGYSMKSKPGLTAFISMSQLYAMLSEDEKKMVDHSWVEYAPLPYKWIEHCKGNTNGLGLATEGKEHTMEEMEEIGYNPDHIKRYPMAWLNPVTGEKAFMVHGLAARKLFIRKDATSSNPPEIIDDVTKIRKFLADIQLRILKPEYVLLPPAEEGDVVMWDNYGCFHSAVDYPLEGYGPRSMHQANIGASVGPRGPVPIPVVAS